MVWNVEKTDKYIPAFTLCIFPTLNSTVLCRGKKIKDGKSSETWRKPKNAANFFPYVFSLCWILKSYVAEKNKRREMVCNVEKTEKVFLLFPYLIFQCWILKSYVAKKNKIRGMVWNVEKTDKYFPAFTLCIFPTLNSTVLCPGKKQKTGNRLKRGENRKTFPTFFQCNFPVLGFEVLCREKKNERREMVWNVEETEKVFLLFPM
jgi:hypothetical protein